ncbi:hypothetical protein BJ875DRAFT_508466 [Amylocarpus encephaloides]|uniref:Acetyl-CoA synthetase-like protein n=1 Tax=Amylocarpus encephaloides TaxID=45428 RepID=A0A9P7Y7H4_9HELO|nr:hypothetical protein BJ875DRAFT_508466 [Amylocarpus encephaloides]
MVFTPPSWVPPMPFDPPDSIPISEFILSDAHGREPTSNSRNPFTCGLSGKTYTAAEHADRVELLSRALAAEFGWHPNQGTEWDKVVGIFALNTIDSMTLAYAVHRLSGVATPANAAYSASELEFQLKSSGATSLFTCVPLLETSLKAAKAAGIPTHRVYILEMPKAFSETKPAPFKTIGQLIIEGARLPDLEPLKWEKGQGKRQTAYLCYSSGTSGLPKGVMISHQNVISNVIQFCTMETHIREKRPQGETSEVVLGLLPLSHIYGLVVIAHIGAYRGDEVIILPKLELPSFLNAIQTFKIASLYVVPPIIIQLTKNQKVCSQYDLSSVHGLFTGAAPLGAETAEELQKVYPSWKIKQGYGLTETCTVVCGTPEHDIWFGSSGSLIPGFTAKIMSPDGTEISGYDQPGELVVQSPSVVLGYLSNEKANRETFIADTDGKGRWMRTGDEAVVRKSPNGHEHIFIVDRIKELIKVKGLQVAPAELEAHLLSHPAVADCAVIPIPNDAAGEVPKAFVVKSSSVGIEDHDRMVARDICKWVEEHKARHKWLKGGVEFIDVVPKSPSGKILRRLLRDKEKEARREKDKMSSHPHQEDREIADFDENESDMLDPNEAAEEIANDDGDVAMDSGSDHGGGDGDGEEQIMEELTLHNDSSAHFDKHKDSIFAIAQHPTRPNIVATGGSEGDDGEGIGYIFDSTPEVDESPMLPASYQTSPAEPKERGGIEPVSRLEGHQDSINALTFTLPKGEFLVSGGLDGKLRAYGEKKGKWDFVAEAQEVEEINWLASCPNPMLENTIALGANDGSVWVYTITSDLAAPLQIVQSYFLHTESCTAGSWSADGKLLATVSEDGSLYVWDVFGEAAAAGLTQDNGQTVLGLTSLDQRFAVEGGLFSVGIAPGGAFVVVGGAGGSIKVVGLPRLSTGAAAPSSKSKGRGGKATGNTSASAGQSGQILADLQAQTDGIETIAFAPPPLTLLATGSVDGSIVLFDSAHRFSVRRHIKEAHEEHSVVKVEFVKNERTGGWLLTSCGMDGVVRRWDTRGGTGMANSGFVKEWRGHRGDGEGGGVMGFVQGDGSRIVTAGDDGVSLVFESPVA